MNGSKRQWYATWCTHLGVDNKPIFSYRITTHPIDDRAGLSWGQLGLLTHPEAHGCIALWRSMSLRGDVPDIPRYIH